MAGWSRLCLNFMGTAELGTAHYAGLLPTMTKTDLEAAQRLEHARRPDHRHRLITA
jgi:hypothetical protein